MDPVCLTQEQQQNINDLVSACKFLLEVKRRKMDSSAVDFSIEQIAAVISKIDKVAA